MEPDDEEFDKLLGEIPRATSASPHVEDLQSAEIHLLGEGGGDTEDPTLLTKAPVVGESLARLLPAEAYVTTSFAKLMLRDGSSVHVDKEKMVTIQQLARSTSNGKSSSVMQLDSGAHVQMSPSRSGAPISACLPRMPYCTPLYEETAFSVADSSTDEMQPNFGMPAKPQAHRVMANIVRRNQSRMDTQRNEGHPFEMFNFSQEQVDFACVAVDPTSLCHPLGASALASGGTRFIANIDATSSFFAPHLKAQQHLADGSRMQQALLLHQHLQEQHARFHACMQGPPNSRDTLAYRMIPPDPSFKSHMPRPVLANVDLQSNQDWKQYYTGAIAPILGSQRATPCHYFDQGFCSRGESRPFTHSPGSLPDSYLHDAYFPLQKATNHKGPRNLQAAQMAVLAGSSGMDHVHVPSSSAYLSSQNSADANAFGDHIWSDQCVQCEEASCHHAKQQQPSPKYSKLEEVEGRIYSIAKDQHGCRFLQRKCEERSPEDVHKIFSEVIGHIVELMTDPFGNYLVQKLLEVCDASQKREILYRMTEGNQLVNVSLNMHGTRTVQKLIETLSFPEHVAMVISSLQHGVVTLIKDLNGNHVVQRCLQHLKYGDCQFIFDAAISYCVEIATHRHGCCVLQRCIDYSSGEQREQLVAEIASNALALSQDPFGNYVVQYILDLGLAWATKQVIKCLDGDYAHLAMQKFSSNVVEKCLKCADEESREHIIQELISSSRIAQLLQDPFANYVIQSALTVSKGLLHSGLVDAIRPHLSALRSSPYGKRILSRTNLKK